MAYSLLSRADVMGLAKRSELNNNLYLNANDYYLVDEMSLTYGRVLRHWSIWVLVSLLVHGLWLLGSRESGLSALPAPAPTVLSLGLAQQPRPAPEPEARLEPAPVEPARVATPPHPPKPAPRPPDPVATPPVARAESAAPPQESSAAVASAPTPSEPVPAAPNPAARVEPALSEPVITQSPRYAEPPARPAYPALARRRGWQGEVWLEIEVGPEGRSAEPVLLRSSGFELLDKAALEVARQWRFVPEQRNGRPVATRVRVPVQFALR
ncbi:energy transducer TonB [Pseudomonas sp. WN033]|nr:energy transducer TonB [Pseudomonas sp. WN033]